MTGRVTSRRVHLVILVSVVSVSVACADSGGPAPSTTIPGAPVDAPAVDAEGEPDPCRLLRAEDRVAVAGAEGLLSSGEIDRDTGTRTCRWTVGDSLVTVTLLRSEWGPGTARERYEADRDGAAAESIAGLGEEAWYALDHGYAVLLDDDRVLYVRAETGGTSDRDLGLEVVARTIEVVP